ncbi:MAG: ATP-binding protein, partial [Synechococcaceae cyanobacterium]|nr:ATP-binding protein [Synechococcaceae cyanobacterium]
LLNLARGSHRRGLGALRASRPLSPEGEPTDGEGPAPLRLVRPLLLLSRSETARFCRERGLPVWPDASNDDLRFRRNRVRAEILPVLEELHPGAVARISALAGRLAEEEEQAGELAALALRALALPPGEAGAAGPQALQREGFTALSPAGQRRLLQLWIRGRCGRGLAAPQLEELVAALAPGRGPGMRDLAGGWRLCWDRRTVGLRYPERSDG